MSDHRWTDVDADLNAALIQFEMAVVTFDAGGFDAAEALEAWQKSNAFLHGMETGYTLLESAIKRILDILDETHPSSEVWHKDLIDRVSRSMPGDNGRPAIFDPAIKQDLLELMRMRHRARKAIYDDFDPSKAGPSVEAARRILATARPAIAEFKRVMDPDPDRK